MEVNHFLVLICCLEKSVHLQHSLRGICLSGGIYFWKELYGQGTIFRKAIFLGDDYPWEQLSGGQSNSGAITLDGNFLGDNYSGGNHPGDNYLGGNYPGGQFSSGQLSQNQYLDIASSADDIDGRLQNKFCSY